MLRLQYADGKDCGRLQSYMAVVSDAFAFLSAETMFPHWLNWQWWLNQKAIDIFKVQDWLFENYVWVKQQVGPVAGCSICACDVYADE